MSLRKSEAAGGGKETLNAFDIVILTILGITAGIGLWKGLVRQVLTLVGVIAGYILAINLYRPVSGLFTGIDPDVAKIISFIGIFALCIILASIVSWLIGRFLQITGLGFLNRIAGAALGLVKGLLIVVVIVVMLLTFLPSDNRMLKDSVTLPYIVSIIKNINVLVPDGLKKRYRMRMEEMKQKWLQRQLDEGINTMLNSTGKEKEKRRKREKTK